MASIGLVPQDLKFGGEPTRVVIGDRNVIREFVTIHRGTAGGGGMTQHRRPQPADGLHAHRARLPHRQRHDLRQRRDAGRPCASSRISPTSAPFSGVHQFCRVGQYAFIGGYSVVTKDALPFVKTVGNRARIYGINTIGLMRRGFSQDTIAKLRRAYRILLHANTSRALAQIERDPALQCAGDPLRRGVHPLVQARRRAAATEPPAGGSASED